MENLIVRASVINFLLQMPILFLLPHPGTNVFPYKLGQYPDLMGIYRIQAVAIQSLVQHQWPLWSFPWVPKIQRYFLLEHSASNIFHKLYRPNATGVLTLCYIRAVNYYYFGRCLGGSVGWASASGLGHDLESQVHSQRGVCFSVRSPTPPTTWLILSLTHSLSNKISEKKKITIFTLTVAKRQTRCVILRSFNLLMPPFCHM